jgi:CBS domain-containing protein
MLVRECLRKAPVTVSEQCTMREAAGLMQDHGVGAASRAQWGRARRRVDTRPRSLTPCCPGR